MRLIDAIRSRRLYKRVAVLSGSRSAERFTTQEQGLHNSIYERFWNYRLDADFVKMEAIRVQLESSLIFQLKQKAKGLSPYLDESDRRRIEDIEGVHPLILVDIPIKATGRRGTGNQLRYLTEDSVGVHSDNRASTPSFESSTVDLDDRNFDLQVGKIRIFAHPEYRDSIVRV